MNDQDQETLVEAIRRFQAAQKLSTPALAALFGMSRRTLEGVLQGRSFPHSRLMLLAIEGLRAKSNPAG